MNFLEFFFANTFLISLVFLSRFLNSSNFLKSSFSTLLLKISPALPFNKNSLGPFLQLLEMTNKLHKADSIITNPGCKMVIEDIAKHMPADGSVTITNNTKYHNFFNGGEQNRIHLVACILENPFEKKNN